MPLYVEDIEIHNATIAMNHEITWKVPAFRNGWDLQDLTLQARITRILRNGAFILVKTWSSVDVLNVFDNAIIIHPGDECFELDGPEGTMIAKHTIKNVTAYTADSTSTARWYT